MSAAAVCSLLILSACGGDSDDQAGPPGGALGATATGGGPTQPGAAGADPKPSSSPKLWDTLEFKDFPHPAIPLNGLDTANCPSYTTKLAGYGKPGMVTKSVSAFGSTNGCIGWRTENTRVSEIKAGLTEYEVGFNCQPVYPNVDSLQERLSGHLKEKDEAQPTTTYSPFYKLSEFEKGYVFAVVREGTVGSSSITATYVSDKGLCTALFTVKRWTAQSDGTKKRQVGLNEAETFKEFNLILNKMISG